MPENDELDRYRVPLKSRFKIFQWGLGGMSATATVLLIMLLNCVYSGSDKVEELMNARLEDFKEAARKESMKQVQQADRQISPQINEATQGIDSLKKEIQTLKN